LHDADGGGPGAVSGVKGLFFKVNRASFGGLRPCIGNAAKDAVECSDAQRAMRWDSYSMRCRVHCLQDNVASNLIDFRVSQLQQGDAAKS
jgi:hypothetical protein